MRTCIACKGQKTCSIPAEQTGWGVAAKAICPKCNGTGEISDPTPLELFKNGGLQNFRLAIGWELGYYGNKNDPDPIFATERAIDSFMDSTGYDRLSYCKTEVLILTDGKSYIVVRDSDTDIRPFKSV